MEEYRPKLIFRDPAPSNAGPAAAVAGAAAYRLAPKTFSSTMANYAFRIASGRTPVSAASIARKGVKRRVRATFSHLVGATNAVLNASRSPSFLQRVIVKTRVVKSVAGVRGKVRAHMNYITRDGAGRDAERAEIFTNNDRSTSDFVSKLENEEHHFRLILSPENASNDMEKFTRQVMERMEEDLGTGLEWKAVVHYNTDHPHAHVVLRGVDDQGKTLFIPNQYLTCGIRERAQRTLTRELGHRTTQDLENTLNEEVHSLRPTSLDRALEGLADDAGVVDLSRSASKSINPQQHRRLARRADFLERQQVGQWGPGHRFTLSKNWNTELRASANVVEMASRSRFAFGGEQRVVVDLNGKDLPKKTIIGEVRARGLADELYDRPYVIIDGADGRAYHKVATRNDTLDQINEGSIVAIDLGSGNDPRKIRGLSQSLSHAVQEPNANWLDAYGQNKTGGARHTAFQRRISDAVGQRDRFLQQVGEKDVFKDPRAFERWAARSFTEQSPAALRAGMTDQTEQLLFSSDPQRFTGQVAHVVQGAKGRFALIVDRNSNAFAAIPVRAADSLKVGHQIGIHSMPEMGAGRNALRIHSLTRSL
ncbi:DUF3363 domain-containing protein [Thalassobaculum salexigens]|uniref:DUF3363 domain-containing protein n=1 Tax=Thalassobaculum salexigens TaxID=455360 RepID=UPI000A07BCFA|nr:DUF3363 domain-containing protein [Thalassobaculum salexigens]